jgi:hypothetical protein
MIGSFVRTLRSLFVAAVCLCGVAVEPAWADELLVAAEMPVGDRTRLTRQIESLREELMLNLGRSSRRFLGTYPLARLIVPFPMMAQQENITETVYHDSASEAVRGAAERVDHR